MSVSGLSGGGAARCIPMATGGMDPGHVVSRAAETSAGHASARSSTRGRPLCCSKTFAGPFREPILLPRDGYHHIVRHFDGQSTLSEIQGRVLRQTGLFLPLHELEDLVRRLDAAMIIEGPTFAAFYQTYRESGRRPAALAGRSYAATVRALQAQLEQFFVDSHGSGAPAGEGPPVNDGLRGVLSPHIDFQRGGPVYTWSYKELVENSAADTFVVLGVAHQYCRRRFALTLKDFETPLGVVPTDRSYVDRIAALAGRDLFDDELSHRTEHSIEFQVVFLQYVLGGRRDFTIVPILVGSFHDLMERGIDPIDDPDVSRFVQALEVAERACGKSVVYIGGIDLCHVGPEFGDPAPVDVGLQEQVRQFDGSMLDRAAAGDPRGWFRTAAAVGNRYRVCGLAATYTMLHAMGPSRGRLLKYKQAIDDKRHLLRELRQHGVSCDRALLERGRGPCTSTCLSRRRRLPQRKQSRNSGRAPGRPTFAPRSRATTPRPRSATGTARAIEMTYRVLGQGPPLFLVPGIASTYRCLRAALEPARRPVPDHRLRLSRRAPRRRRQPRPDQPRRPGRRPLRPDRSPRHRPGVLGRHLLRLDDRAQGPLPRAGAVFEGGRARSVFPSQFHHRRAVGAPPGKDGAGSSRSAALAQDCAGV